jgi:hypothetical protein
MLKPNAIRQYLEECSEHAGKISIIGWIAFGVVLWEIVQNILPFANIELKVPKIPLPWVLTIFLLMILTVVILGGQRRANEIEKQFSDIAGPELWIGYDSSTIQEPPLCFQNNGGGIAYNVSLKIPLDGSVFTSNKEPILRDDRTPTICRGDTVSRVTFTGLIFANAKTFPVLVTCMDHHLRTFEYIFEPLPHGSGFALKSKVCSGRVNGS